MEPLPFIDEHLERLEASPERVWAALLTTIGKSFARNPPRLVCAVWGLQQTTRLGDWATSVAIGDTMPGFAVAQCEPTRLLTLRGRHRFSRYELRFELQSPLPGCVEIHARTSAAFPGWPGRLYRALVIGTGGHRIVVRRLLAAVARRAAA